MSEEIGMYINVRAKGIAQADNELEKLANTAENAEKKAQKLGMTFDSYSKTLSGLQTVAKATGASQETIANANLRVSQTANTLVDSNGNVIASLKRVSDTAQQAGMGMGDYFKRLESMKRSAYTTGISQKELANSYLTVTQGAYHLTNANGNIVRSLSRVADGAKKAREEANRLNQMHSSVASLKNITLSPIGSFIADSGLSMFNREIPAYISNVNAANSVTGKMQASSIGATQAINGLKIALGSYLSLSSVDYIKDSANTMTLLGNQIKQVTSSQQEMNGVQNELLSISDRTYVKVEATTTLYTRTAKAMKDYGKTQQEVLGFTESINNAMRIGGVNATEQASAMLQLSQALGSGRLQGDELRSISEAAPILLDYISEYMKVSRSELKKLGSEGKITGEIIFNAMSQAGDSLKEMAENMPITTDQAFNRVRNNFLRLVDDLANESGLMEGVNKSIVAVANNLDTVLIPVGMAAALMAGRLTNSLIASTWSFATHELAVAKASLGLTKYSAVAKAAAASSASASITARGLSGALSLIGGPAGILTSVAIGFGAYALTSKKAVSANYAMKVSTGELGLELKKLDESFVNLSKRQQEVAVAKQQSILVELTQKAGELRKEISYAEKEIHGMSFSGTFWNIFGTTTADKNEAIKAVNELKEELVGIEDAAKIAKDWLDKVLGKNSNEETFSGKYLEEFDVINKKFLEIGLNQQALNNLKYDEWLLSGQIKDFERDNLRLMNEQAFTQLALNNAREKGIKVLESINDRYEKIGMNAMQSEVHDIKKLGLSQPDEEKAIKQLKEIYANKPSGGGRSDPFTDRLKSLSEELSSLQAMNIEYAKYGDISKYTAAKELTLEFENQSSALYKVSDAQKAVLMLQAQSVDSQKQLNEILMLSNDYSKDLSDMEFEISLIGQTQKAIEQLTFSRDLEKRVKELSIGMSAENIAKLQEETAGILQQKAAVEALRAIKENDVLGGIGDGVKKSIEEAGTVRDQWAEASKFAFDSMADSFASFASGTQTSFRDMTTSILQDLSKILIKAAIVNSFAGMKDSGGILGAIGSAFGGKADGGIVGYANGGAVGVPYRIGSLATSGGYTGAGGKYEEADIVHKGEVVFSQRDVANHGGVAATENLRLRGYANGGIVGGMPVSAPMQYQRAQQDSQPIELTVIVNSDGSTEIDATKDGKALDNMIKVTVRKELSNQMRAGGQLAKR